MYQKFIIIMHGKYILEMFLATVVATVAKQLLAGITKFMNFAFFFFPLQLIVVMSQTETCKERSMQLLGKLMQIIAYVDFSLLSLYIV